LANIVTGLPSSVFGDPLAREHTRVLIDLVADTKECSRIDRAHIAPYRKFVDAVVEMLVQVNASLPPTSQTRTIVSVLREQPAPMRMKVTLKQLVFSKLMLADHSSREELMTRLLLVDPLPDDDSFSLGTSPSPRIPPPPPVSTSRTNVTNLVEL